MVNMVCSCQFIVVTIGALYNVDVDDCYFIIILYSQHAHRFFHLGVHVPFYLHFWGYIQMFGGAMYPLTLHLGVQRKLTAFSSRKVVHHAVFCKYYAELAKTFFSVWHWVRQEVWFSLTHGLCVCPTIFL